MAEDDKVAIEGQSFRNEALTGSGTILEDGTYGDPLPDPTEVRGLGPRRTSGGRLLPDAPSDELAGVYDAPKRSVTPDTAYVEPGDADAKPAPKKSASASK